MIGIGIRIPQTGKAPFSPASLGAPLAWLKGDDATWDGSAELGAGVYSALTNRGSLGGTFAAASNAAPIAVAVGTRNVPAFRGTRRAASSVSVASWPFLHNASGTATLTVRFYLYDTGGSYRVFATSAGGAAPGVRLLVTGSKAVAIWSNASADSLTLTSTANVAAGWNTVTVTKNAAACAMSLNGETALTGSIGTPSAANPSHVPCLGNVTAGASASALNGLVAELVIHGTVLDSSGLSLMRSYMSGQWSATPSYSPLQESADLIQWLVASKGTTVATGISAWADQSGYNNDVIQGTGANQPALTSSAINGLPGSTGDGSDDVLSIAAFTNGTISQPFVRYIVGKIETWTFNRYIVGAPVNSGSLFLSSVDTVSPALSGAYAGTTVNAASTGQTGNDLEGRPFVIRAIFDGASSNFRWLYNGAAERVASGTAGGGTLAGSNYHALAAASVPSHSTISESLVFSGTAGSNTSASDVHDTRLRTKYAVTP